MKNLDKLTYLTRKFNINFDEISSIVKIDLTSIKVVTKTSIKKMYKFFINRMIASSFFKISKKQQLNNKVLDKLFECVINFEQFNSKTFTGVNDINEVIIDAAYEEPDSLI